MSNTVRDRSGLGMPSKAERRALGKAAARKRAEQRRRRELLSRVGRVAAPIAVIGVIALAVWLFRGGEDPATNASPGSGSTTEPTVETTPWTLPEGLDPQLGTRPVAFAGEGGPLTDVVVTTIVEGAGAPLQPGQTVTVNYVGVSYASGAEFDASWNRGQPFSFTLGAGGVIQGWDQGLVGVPVGSRVQLDIPVTMAYNNTPGYPEGDLRFIVDVLSAS